MSCNICTSLNDPPTVDIRLDVSVINVLRPLRIVLKKPFAEDFKLLASALLSKLLPK
jgi:hypothetical protein